MNESSLICRRPLVGVFSLLCLMIVPLAQADRLTLDQAIQQAKKQNGTLRSAVQDLVAAKARTVQARAAFMPTLTPRLQYTDTVRNIPNAQFGNQTLNFNQTQTNVALSWRVLDAGQRLANLQAQRASESATEATSKQTIRQVLFNVQQSYIETLRAQALEQVASAQLGRAEKVLDQTKTRVQVGDAAKTEILQAEADFLNASVSTITARNRTNTNAANLKAIIGLSFDSTNPELDALGFQLAEDLPKTLKEAIEIGLQTRPDLIARRRNNEASARGVRSALIESGLTYALDLSYNRLLSPGTGSDQNIFFNISFPLSDGGNSRATYNERKALFNSALLQTEQAEKDAQSEIEAAYLTLEQNQKRLEAANLAVRAARLNFDAASGSRQAGAGDLIQVLTAQVSLVTAESNAIEATYDALLSQLRLRLAIGLPLAGEEN